MFRGNKGDKALGAALLKGVTEAKVHQARKKGDLQKAYNAASGLLKGLSSLQVSGSQFEFKVLEKETSLEIETNIPAATRDGRGAGKVIVMVEPNRRIRVRGDMRLEYVHFVGNYVSPRPKYNDQVISSRRRGATKKALKYVAQKASEKGLLPF